jgi:hypothetical protein
MKVDIHENPALAKRCRVYLDGVDISRDCYAADDATGEALCYRQDAEGKPYKEWGPHGWQVAREIRRGKVVIVVGNA